MGWQVGQVGREEGGPGQSVGWDWWKHTPNTYLLLKADLPFWVSVDLQQQ